MAPQKHLAVSANTTRVFSPEHRGICTALRCEANTSAFLAKGKHLSPPSPWHKEPASDEDVNTSLGRALQNEYATCPCVAERHPAVRSACWPLTPAAGEFAAAKTSRDRPMAAAEAKARRDTPGGPGPGPSRCAKANPRLCTRGVPGPGSSSLSTNAQPFLCVGARLVHTREFSPDKWGQVPLRSTFTHRPRSSRDRSRRERKGNKSLRS